MVTTVAGMGAAKAGKAAKAAKAEDKAAGAAKAVEKMTDTAKTARKAGKLSGALDRASDVGKASRAALSSIKKSATGMIDRALTSNTVKKAARKADDFIRDVRSMLTPPELQPALVTGVLDDVDDVGFFTKYYDDLVKKKKPSLSESGVKIEKAEIVGGSGDVVDGAGDLGGGVKKGGSVDGKLQNVKPSLSEGSKPIGNYAKTTIRTYIRQNESADLLASKGYKVNMLDEVHGGNGYGINELANPDFLIEDKVFDCYTPNVNTSTKTIIRELAQKTKDQAPNIVLNLDDYAGDIKELIDLIKRKTNSAGDLKRLEELKIIKDGNVVDIFD